MIYKELDDILSHEPSQGLDEDTENLMNETEGYMRSIRMLLLGKNYNQDGWKN